MPTSPSSTAARPRIRSGRAAADARRDRADDRSQPSAATARRVGRHARVPPPQLPAVLRRPGDLARRHLDAAGRPGLARPELTHDPIWLGVVAAAQFMPVMVFGLFAGVARRRAAQAPDVLLVDPGRR